MKISKTLLTALLCLIALSAKAYDVPTKLWLVGDATKPLYDAPDVNGWVQGDANHTGKDRPATKDGDWYVFEWENINLTKGELKFFYNNTDWDYCIYASAYTNRDVATTGGRKLKLDFDKTDDRKFNIASNLNAGDMKNCTITVRISENGDGTVREMYLTVAPDGGFKDKDGNDENYCHRTLYAVGSATPGGWVAKKGTPFKFDLATGLHTIEKIALKPDSEGNSFIRFSDGNNDFYGPQLCPSLNDKKPINLETMDTQFTEKCGFNNGGEWNWSVSQPGNYRIEIQAPPFDIDFNGYDNYEVKFTRLADDPKIYPVGGAVKNVGWDASKTTAMISKGNGVYECSLTLNGYGSRTLDKDNSDKYALKFLVDTQSFDQNKSINADSENKKVDGTTADLSAKYWEVEPQDYKWLIKQTGVYTITLTLNDDAQFEAGKVCGKVNFKLDKALNYADHTFYMVGAATGESWGDAGSKGKEFIKVADSDNQYSYTGYINGLDGLNISEANKDEKDRYAFKFVSAQGDGVWNSAELRAASDWAQITELKLNETTTVKAVLNATDDFKWIPTKSGKYEIILTFVDDSNYVDTKDVADLSFKLIEETPMIFLGQAADWMSCDKSDKVLTKTEDGKYIVTFSYDSYAKNSDNNQLKTIKFATHKGNWNEIIYLLPNHETEGFDTNILPVTLGTAYNYQIVAAKYTNGNWGVDDYFWNLPEGHFGQYTATIDPVNKTVTFDAGPNGATYFNKNEASKIHTTGILDWKFSEGDHESFLKPEGTDNVWFWSGDMDANAAYNTLEETFNGVAGTRTEIKNATTGEVERVVYVHEGTRNQQFRIYYENNGTKYYFTARHIQPTNGIILLDGSDNSTSEAALRSPRRENQQYTPRPERKVPLTITTADDAPYFGLTEGSIGHYNIKLDLNNLALVYNMQHSQNEGGGVTSAGAVAAAELSVAMAGETLVVRGNALGEVRVLSMAGATVAAVAAQSEAVIDMAGLPSGVYLVCAQGGVVKIIK